MAKVIYIPLDERPVNLDFPQQIMADCSEIELVAPPKGMLGLKKRPTPVAQLWDWLESNLAEADYLIASLDMLLYGGIVPSRLHHYSEADCQERLARLASLKEKYPQVKIYAFNLIMRVPGYNSSDEEPDYYEQYGERIFRMGWLTDKIGRNQDDPGEADELADVTAAIPEEVRRDYLGRRGVNHFVNRQAVELTATGVLDFLVIPLDDCAEYGFSAAEQRGLLRMVEEKTLHDRVHIYPGADEVGCTLTTRIYNKIRGSKPRVFVRYSSTMGPTLIPKYEDRPLGESIKSQITVSGGVIVDNSLEADVILMVNSPTLGGRKMQDAPGARINKDTSYYSFRNLREFTESIRYYLENGEKVALGDVAFGNGADDEFLRLLAKQGLLSKLLSYAGWNTPGNTLGTVIAHALVRCQQSDEVLGKVNKFVLDRFVEDWGYQVLVRSYLRDIGDELGINYFDLKDQQPRVSVIAKEKFQEFIGEHLPEFADVYSIESVYFPWNRLFEVGFTSKLK